MIRFLILLISFIFIGCEQTFNLSNPAAPTPGSTTISNTNTNTNTATNNPDKTGSDTGAPATPSPNDPNSVIPLPTYGEATTRAIAANNGTLLANSCQDKYGESAWAFLDLVIKTLQIQDARWGYLCKDGTCTNKARDIVAYRASSGNTGIWIVDVIGNHCPGPNDFAEVRWGVLPFETTRPWIGVR